MEEHFKNKRKKIEIPFNENYNTNLIDTSTYRIILAHIQQIYPKVYDLMNHEQSFERYIDPKIMTLMDYEAEYHAQGYPFCGEPAMRDLFALIAAELQPYEDEEYLEEFDLDKQFFIDTEEI
ncbi:hypothetical protein ACRASX_14715 [Flavobacterium sp. TMP13]|uniref:hypothetical protein n=1 Tax=Flavobacterium sp. TMP13 TaxID=3425950 RepID=UPI003D777155